MRGRWGLAALLLPLAAVAQEAPDVARGGRLYVSTGCYQCHGGVGQGAAMSGPKLSPDPLPAGAFAAYVRAPRNVMPAYAATVLDDAALRDIRAWVAALPRPPAARDVPALRALAGEGP